MLINGRRRAVACGNPESSGMPRCTARMHTGRSTPHTSSSTGLWDAKYTHQQQCARWIDCVIHLHHARLHLPWTMHSKHLQYTTHHDHNEISRDPGLFGSSLYTWPSSSRYSNTALRSTPRLSWGRNIWYRHTSRNRQNAYQTLAVASNHPQAPTPRVLQHSKVSHITLQRGHPFCSVHVVQVQRHMPCRPCVALQKGSFVGCTPCLVCKLCATTKCV